MTPRYCRYKPGSPGQAPMIEGSVVLLVLGESSAQVKTNKDSQKSSPKFTSLRFGAISYQSVVVKAVSVSFPLCEMKDQDSTHLK